MSRPVNPPKPTLAARCSDRDMTVGNVLSAFEEELRKWIATCVTSRTVDPSTKSSFRREYELVDAAARDVQAIFDYVQSSPPSMRLGGTYTVHADFQWGRLNNGYWFVRGVGFSIRGRVDWHPVDPPERRIIHGFQPRIETFSIDIGFGEHLSHDAENTAYQQARKEAKLVENPIEPPSFKDMGKTGKEVAKGGDIPGTEMGKLAIGAMLQAFINSGAGEVARVRHRAYAWFAEGYIQVLAETDAGTPANAFEKKYFELGQDAARQLNKVQRYQVQIYLLRSWSLHPTSGWKIPHSQEWTFPDDYQKHWDPRLMAEALFNELYATKFSVGGDFEAKEAAPQ